MLYVGKNTVAPNNVINTGIEQVQSDYAQVDTTAVDYIKNKPTLASVATSGDYNDLSNTPTIPTVNDATLTITQNGTNVGTFTANASSDITVNLTDTTYSAFTGADGVNAGSSGLVPAPTAVDNEKFLKGDGTWATVSGGGASYTAGTGISISNGAISVTDPTLQNTSTGSNSLTILGNNNSNTHSVNIGVYSKAADQSVAVGSYAEATGYASVAIGQNTNTKNQRGSIAIGTATYTWGEYNVAIGPESTTFGEGTIQIGKGTNDEANTVKFGNGTNNWKLLDLTTGLIPADRLPSTTPSIDNTTITKNSSDQLQASAVMNARTGTDVMPIWQGTEQEWTNGKATDWYNWKNKTGSANFTIVGTPTITDGVLTIPTDNTGTKIYATNVLPQVTQSDTIEVVVKLKRDALESSLNEELIELWANGTTMNYMDKRAFSLWGSNNGSYYWQAESGGSVTVTGSQANTWFYIKFNVSYAGGSEWNMSACASDDGQTWGTASTNTVLKTFDFTKSNILIGCHLGTKTSNTLIDLNECYVKVNDTIVWKPYSETIYGQVYTLEATPTTASTVYSAPNTPSALTITSVGTGTITLSDNNTYTYTSSGDVTTYQTIGEAYPNYLANINGVGVKVGNTLVANKTELTAGTGIDITDGVISGTDYVEIADFTRDLTDTSIIKMVPFTSGYTFPKDKIYVMRLVIRQDPVGGEPTPIADNTPITIQDGTGSVISFMLGDDQATTFKDIKALLRPWVNPSNKRIMYRGNILGILSGVGSPWGMTFVVCTADNNPADMQTTTNLVTSVSSSSTDTQYPSAKLLYDTVGNIEATLDAIIAQGSNS